MTSINHLGNTNETQYGLIGSLLKSAKQYIEMDHYTVKYFLKSAENNLIMKDNIMPQKHAIQKKAKQICNFRKMN